MQGKSVCHGSPRARPVPLDAAGIPVYATEYWSIDGQPVQWPDQFSLATRESLTVFQWPRVRTPGAKILVNAFHGRVCPLPATIILTILVVRTNGATYEAELLNRKPKGGCILFSHGKSRNQPSGREAIL